MKNDRELKVVNIRLVEHPSFYGDYRISQPRHAVEFLANEFSDLDREIVCVLNLNTKGRVLNMNFVSVGTVDASVLEPREFYKSAILSNASSCIAIHNHPSGDVTPSRADLFLTEKLMQVGALLGVPLLDHVIVGGGEEKNIYSFLEHGLIKTRVQAMAAEDTVRYGIGGRLDAAKEKVKTAGEKGRAKDHPGRGDHEKI